MQNEDKGSVDRLKMYILIKEDVPMGFALVAASHASLAAYLRFKEDQETVDWVQGIFFKTICVVNEREFERAKEVQDHVVITESALDGRDVALAFRPRREWPKYFRFMRLYR